MRIVQAYKVYRPDVDGGIAEVMSQIARLRLRGDDVRVLVAKSQGRSEHYQWENTPVDAVGSFGEALSMPLAPTFPLALKRAAKDCDILALHAPFPLNDLGLFLGAPKETAIVLHWHAEILGRRIIMPLIRPIIRNTIKRADRIIVTHPSIVDASPFLANFAYKCISIPYGIDTRYWETLDRTQLAAAQTLRRSYPRLIVAVGRLVPYKGYDVLLRAMQSIDGELIIIGEGKQREHLTSLAQNLGVSDRVQFKGFVSRDQMKIHLHAAQVFALPSISTAEAFGIVQIEAMAAGLPIINTNLPTTVPTIARNNIEGLTVEPGDSHALAKALTYVLDNRVQANAMRSAARARARDEYSNAVFLSRVREVYQDSWMRRNRRTIGLQGS